MGEDEIKGEESGRPQPVLPSSLNRLSGFFFYFFSNLKWMAKM